MFRLILILLFFTPYLSIASETGVGANNVNQASYLSSEDGKEVCAPRINEYSYSERAQGGYGTMTRRNGHEIVRGPDQKPIIDVLLFEPKVFVAMDGKEVALHYLDTPENRASLCKDYVGNESKPVDRKVRPPKNKTLVANKRAKCPNGKLGVKLNKGKKGKPLLKLFCSINQKNIDAFKRERPNSDYTAPRSKKTAGSRCRNEGLFLGDVSESCS